VLRGYVNRTSMDVGGGCRVSCLVWNLKFDVLTDED